MKNYTVRFSSVKLGVSQPAPRDPPAESPRRRHKSRHGCRNCKKSRVKCDEAYPVCHRCARTGQVCRSIPREPVWQVELPGVTVKIQQPEACNPKLLQHWFARTSQIMVTDNDPGVNPWSYSIAPYLSVTRSLVHILQSFSAAHEHYFRASQLECALEERGKCMAMFRVELQEGRQPLHHSFLTAYLLGLSASYFSIDRADFGEEHLLAARTMVALILSSVVTQDNPLTHFAIGCYVYWEMSCALLMDMPPQVSLNNPQPDLNDPDPISTLIKTYLDSTTEKYHPVTAYYTGLFACLGELNKHIRGLRTTGIHDIVLELELEERLLQWEIDQSKHQYWAQTAEAFRANGLLMLYRFCRPLPVVDLEDGDEDSLSQLVSANEALTRGYALKVLEFLRKIPVDANQFAKQPLLLLSSGAELTPDDNELRDFVRERFNALVSLNRIPTQLWASELLAELWELKDNGHNVTWLDLMFSKGWRLMLG